MFVRRPLLLPRVLLSRSRPLRVPVIPIPKQDGCDARPFNIEAGKGPLRTLIAILWPERRHLTLAAISLCLGSSATLSFPYFTGKMVDVFGERMSAGGATEMWVQAVQQNTGLCVAALAVTGLAGFARLYLLETAAEKVSRRLRLTLFESLVHKPLSFYDAPGHRSGELVNRLSQDITTVSRSVLDASFGLRMCINALAGSVLVAKLAPLSTIPQLLAPVVLLFAGAVAYGRFVRTVTQKKHDALASSMQFAEERLSNIRAVKLYRGEVNDKKRFGKLLDHVYSLAQKVAIANGGRNFVVVSCGGGFIVHIIYSCGMLIADGVLTLGQTSSLAAYLALSGSAYQGMMTAYGDLQKALGASQRVVEIVSDNQGRDRCGIKPLIFTTDASAPEIMFRDIHFQYPQGCSPVLDGLNLTIPGGGCKQAIVGSSGCGKSSLILLLSKLYMPSKGVTSIGGIDIAGVHILELRRHLATVLQEQNIFVGSVADNIFYPHIIDSPSDLDSLVSPFDREKLTAASALSTFGGPDAWASRQVGERGMHLSGGQRQRVCVARALATKYRKNEPPPPILLLDEATSALDNNTEAQVLKGFEDFGGTALAITHRMSTITWSDRLAVMDRGRIAQEGPTHEVLANPGPVLRKLLQTLDEE